MNNDISKDNIENITKANLDSNNEILTENKSEENTVTTKEHVHDENCGHNQPRVHLSKKEITTLKRSKYEEEVKKYDVSYVIQNKKTGMVVEMKAASEVHACKMIGWRPKNCKLLEVIKKEVEK